MPARIFLLLASSALALALALSGCGSSSSTDTGGEGTSASPAPAHVSVGSVPPKTPGAVESNAFGAAKPTWVKLDKKPPQVKPPRGSPPSDLVVEDLEPGSGPAAETGDEVTIMYRGFRFLTGKQFTSSWDWGEPTTFVLGGGLEDAGWEAGLVGMKVGGRRELIVPGDFKGSSGFAPGSGPQDSLLYVVDLFAINR